MTKHRAIWGLEMELRTFLTLVLDGSQWSASCPGCFIPGRRTPCTHWIEGWVNLRAGVDAVEKKKNNLTPSGSQILVVIP